MYGLVKLKSGGAKDCIIFRQPQKGYTLSQDLGRLPVEPKTGEEQRALLKDPMLLPIYQAQFIGFLHTCFKCMAVCPACLEA